MTSSQGFQVYSEALKIFGAFKKQMHMPSRAKYILRILFGTFQVTPHIGPYVCNLILGSTFPNVRCLILINSRIFFYVERLWNNIGTSILTPMISSRTFDITPM